MSVELKPCPFCGEQLEAWGVNYRHNIDSGCFLASVVRVTPTDIEAWNRRAASAAPAEGRDKFEFDDCGHTQTVYGTREAINAIQRWREKQRQIVDAALAKVKPAEGREAVDERETGVTPEWLWSELMDYCKERGIAPANNNRLFEIVKRARAVIAAMLTVSAAPVLQHIKDESNGAWSAFHKHPAAQMSNADELYPIWESAWNAALASPLTDDSMAMSDALRMDDDGRIDERCPARIPTMSEAVWPTLTERIIHAIEGECDGLAISVEQASSILAYLQYGAAMSEAQSIQKDAERYRKLRSVDINAIHKGGVFAGLTPDNVVINGEDLDIAVDLLIDRANAEGEKS